MKQFFKFLLNFVKLIFATVIGVMVTIVIIIMIVVVSNDKTMNVDANSVLEMSFNSAIPERTPENPLSGFGFLGFDEDKSIGLNDILANIRKAKTDEHIKGIFFNESDVTPGQATSEEIRNALIDFKKSGKFIVAYAENYTQGFYYLASVADKVYINPRGTFLFHGFSSQITFYKGLMDKLGIEAQIIKVGTYKSAVEPYFLTKMSDANRLQINSYLGSLYSHFLDGISKSRGLNKDSLFNYANNLIIRFPDDALKYKLVDGLKYKDEVLDELKSLNGTAKGDDLKSVDLDDYIKSPSKKETNKKEDTKNQIAIVYASGEISGGEGGDTKIGSEGISKTLRNLREDDQVKAVVFRINSPGGSSLASDVIWREVMLTKKVKPIIVSMGDLAASGGYYIACAADSIFAEPNTITGSIGIFAILPNMQKFFNNKLGVTFDGVKTGKYADLGDITKPLSPEEMAILQNEVDHGYDDFTKAVANGRHKTQAYINSIGQGRVWTGSQAIKIGLVDRLGNIKDAVKSAAKEAKIKSYTVVSYPEQKSLFSNFGHGINSQIKTNMLKSELGINYNYYQQIIGIMQMVRMPQARLPYDVVVN